MYINQEDQTPRGGIQLAQAGNGEKGGGDDYLSLLFHFKLKCCWKQKNEEKSQDLIIIFKHSIKGNFCKPYFLFIIISVFFPIWQPIFKRNCYVYFKVFQYWLMDIVSLESKRSTPIKIYFQNIWNKHLLYLLYGLDHLHRILNVISVPGCESKGGQSREKEESEGFW